MPRPKEVTVAATVAFVGSGIFVAAGTAIGLVSAYYYRAVREQYPQLVPYRTDNPDAAIVLQVMLTATLMPIVLGIVGILTGRGLLRMKHWARMSVIAWCFVSALLCLVGIAYRSQGTGLLFLFMLFLLPVNAWWLLLFFRRDVAAQFGAATTDPPRSLLVQERRSTMAKWMGVSIGTIVVMLLGFYAWHSYQHRQLVHELELSRDAIGACKTWHYHTVRKVPNNPDETIDRDITCPVFQHSTVSVFGGDGSPLVREYVTYFGTGYAYVEGQWKEPARGPYAQQKEEIFECRYGAIGSDENSLTFAAFLEDSSIVRGDEVDLQGETCRNYRITTPTPYDLNQMQFQFTICINERDHLPRQTRRVHPGDTEESVSYFSDWSTSSEPQLPPGFSK